MSRNNHILTILYMRTYIASLSYRGLTTQECINKYFSAELLKSPLIEEKEKLALGENILKGQG